ncbi:MAG: IS1595 family transposase [Gemmatimonadota bacterium]
MIKAYAAPKTLSEAIRYFAHKEHAFAFVVQLRWPNGVACPHCQSDQVSFLSTRHIFKCKECRKQFSVKVGTIFEDSALGLDKWLPALWMLANCKNGISSYELHRALGVTQKTAWFMLHRIRLAMQTKTFQKFSGHVEADETFVGGKLMFMHQGRRARNARGPQPNKTPVMGLLQRGPKGKSRVHTIMTKSLKKPQMQAQVREHVEPGSNLFTDAFLSYRGLGADYIHDVIDHTVSYAEGQIHTNGLENFWSLLKRGIKGTYTSVDPFHLFRYVSEQVFRFNERSGNDGDRFRSVLGDVVGKRLTYAELIGADLNPATT